MVTIYGVAKVEGTYYFSHVVTSILFMQAIACSRDDFQQYLHIVKEPRLGVHGYMHQGEKHRVRGKNIALLLNLCYEC